MKERIPVFRKTQTLDRLDDKICAVREFTAGGVSVGRCMHYVGNDFVCPRHGDVRNVQDQFRSTGRLTNEMDLEATR